MKERAFGLTPGEGNHGEDVKEYYFYLDNTPTHSYMKYLYKYPQAAYPDEWLLTVEADGLWITPVPVNHLVPTVGYVVTDGRSAIIIAGDTGPTKRLWEVAHRTAGLQAIFLEACFPNSMKRLAEASLHLTPEMFGEEVAKMPAGVRVVATHIKVRYRDAVVRELKALGLAQVEIGECEKEYDFSKVFATR